MSAGVPASVGHCLVRFCLHGNCVFSSARGHCVLELRRKLKPSSN